MIGPVKSLRVRKGHEISLHQKHKVLLYHVMTKPNNTIGRTHPPLNQSSSGVANKKKRKKKKSSSYEKLKRLAVDI